MPRSTDNQDRYITRELVLTVDTAAYALGDVVGNLPAQTPAGISPLLRLADVNGKSGRSVLLQSIQVTDGQEQSPAFTILLLGDKPKGGLSPAGIAAAYVDNAALILSEVDIALLAAPIKFAAGDYVTLQGTNGVGSFALQSGIGAVIDIADRDVWVLIHADAAIDFVAADDVRLKFGFDRGTP